jgi:hypothetical protein
MFSVRQAVSTWGPGEWWNAGYVAFCVGLVLLLLVGIILSRRPRTSGPSIGTVFAKLKRKFHAEDLAALEADSHELWKPDPKKVPRDQR